MISADQLDEYFSYLGLTVKYAAVKFESDLDVHKGSMTFTYDDFVDLMNDQDAPEDSHWVKEHTSRIFDRRATGQISPAELAEVLRNFRESISESVIEEVFADAGIDGKITFDMLEDLLECDFEDDMDEASVFDEKRRDSIDSESTCSHSSNQDLSASFAGSSRSSCISIEETPTRSERRASLIEVVRRLSIDDAPARSGRRGSLVDVARRLSLTSQSVCKKLSPPVSTYKKPQSQRRPSSIAQHFKKICF
jgi:Ca2+-binding EF-hand superfamily protein